MKNQQFNSNSLKDDKNEIISKVSEFKNYYLMNKIAPLFNFDEFYCGKKIILSVSGGADSMSLLLTFMNFKEMYNIDFEIINFEHGIRGESSKLDSFFVYTFAKIFDIKFRQINLRTKSKQIELKVTEEEAARILRQEEYKKINGYVLLAHNEEDNNDTILMNIFRGSGLKGLIGMEEKNKNIIRPMLKISRKEIEDYILKNKIPFRHDDSNDKVSYSRNIVRKKIRKEIEKIWPKLNLSLSNLSNIAKNALEHAEKIGKNYIKYFNDSILIDTDLFNEDRFIYTESILYALRKLNVQKDVTKYHIEKIIDLKDKETGKKITLPNSCFAVKENKNIRIFLNNNKNEYFEEKFSLETSKLKIQKVSEFKMEKNSIYIDFDKLSDKAVIRNRRNKDKFVKFDGKIVSLSDYLIKKKIPQFLRDSLILIEIDGLIQAIVPIEVSKNLKVEKDTKQILKIQLID